MLDPTLGTAEQLLRDLEGVEVFDVTIDSDGGDARIGFDLLNGFRGRLRTCTIVGRCCSAAYDIALAASHVQIYEDAKIMLHSTRSWLIGTADELEVEVRDLRVWDSLLAALLRERTEQPAAIVAEWLSKDTWFDAQQALAAGLADEVIPAPKVAQGATEREDGPFVQEDDGSEKMLFDLIQACGVIEVRDQRKFYRNLGMVLSQQIRERVIHES